MFKVEKGKNLPKIEDVGLPYSIEQCSKLLGYVAKKCECGEPVEDKELQDDAWAELIGLQYKLQKIQANIKDFAVEEAIDTINEAITNYINEEE